MLNESACIVLILKTWDEFLEMAGIAFAGHYAETVHASGMIFAMPRKPPCALQPAMTQVVAVLVCSWTLIIYSIY